MLLYSQDYDSVVNSVFYRTITLGSVVQVAGSVIVTLMDPQAFSVTSTRDSVAVNPTSRANAATPAWRIATTSLLDV